MAPQTIKKAVKYSVRDNMTDSLTDFYKYVNGGVYNSVLCTVADSVEFSVYETMWSSLINSVLIKAERFK